jgi:REP element-mobilizing transposase RayT
MADDSLFRPDRRSVRMRGFDYSKEGAYFVTICAAHRRCLFGDVDAGRMVPSLLGRIVEREWHRSAAMRPGLQLDAFTLMPNHMHGIVFIGGGTLAERTWDAPSRRGGTRPGSLSSFVQGFKAATSSCAAREGVSPGGSVWQRGFYDHMIRTERTLSIVRRYIAMNPRLWKRDVENPERIRE